MNDREMNTMQRFLPFTFGLLLAVSLPALAQEQEGSAVEPAVPLNLSLPRDTALTEAKPDRIGDEVSRVDPRPDEDVKAANATNATKEATRRQGGNCQRTGRNDCGAFPYGTGFEARNRGAAGGRGFGRGR
ncbi:MAG: hypothetical protein IPP88_19710 [Betaproteobacteria bacterium]|nr:hypothetical protein [Betaproteobacteria bacterium]